MKMLFYLYKNSHDNPTLMETKKYYNADSGSN